MKSILLFFALTGILACNTKMLFAQQQNQTQSQSQSQTPQPQATQTVQPVKKTTATFLGGLIYAPRLHYYGRTDELKSSAVLPTVNIEFDSLHLYASGTSVFIHNKQENAEYAGTIAELGYRFGHYTHFSGNVYGNKFFYDKRLLLPQSALEEQAGVNLSEHTKYINFSATGSAAFSKERTDFFASAGLNKDFKWKFGKSLLLITPTYVLNMGSQNFSTVNYKNNGGTDQATIAKNRDFKILDHEFSIPIIYAMKHIYLIATPSYIRPENIITIPDFPQLSETGEKLFYVNFSVLFTFKK